MDHRKGREIYKEMTSRNYVVVKRNTKTVG